MHVLYRSSIDVCSLVESMQMFFRIFCLPLRGVAYERGSL